ncbi:hypothetical protein [uncultured Methylophaga sp.]|uniref:hypothetical protein n=1 Tax=uncultured Methylophaga sp. TaxID=285271 RepID=UPI0030F7978C
MIDKNAGSWVCTCSTTGRVWEVFSHKQAVAADKTNVIMVETAMDYLCRINQEAKEAEQ